MTDRIVNAGGVEVRVVDLPGTGTRRLYINTWDRSTARVIAEGFGPLLGVGPGLNGLWEALVEAEDAGPYSDRPVEELVDLIDNQPLDAGELEAANDELERALEELTAEDALRDLASYLECFDGSARTRSLDASLAKLRAVVDAVNDLVDDQVELQNGYVGAGGYHYILELAALVGRAGELDNPDVDEDEEV